MDVSKGVEVLMLVHLDVRLAGMLLEVGVHHDDLLLKLLDLLFGILAGASFFLLTPGLLLLLF